MEESRSALRCMLRQQISRVSSSFAFIESLLHVQAQRDTLRGRRHTGMCRSGFARHRCFWEEAHPRKVHCAICPQVPGSKPGNSQSDGVVVVNVSSNGRAERFMTRISRNASVTLNCLMSVYGRMRVPVGILIGILLVSLMGASFSTPVAHAATGDWPTYGFSNDHTGYNASETTITAANVGSLKLKWIHTGGLGISTEPVEANGLVYWGSWDGYEHATNLSNARVWATYLGQTIDANCGPPKVGVSGAATVVTSGTSSVLYVGGGNAHFYALNAMTGAILWQRTLGSSPSHFIWDAPAVYNGSIYIGMSSFGDCPLVAGQVFQLNASNGTIQHVFNAVPNGCVGAGVWGSPTIDASSGKLYFATGNPGGCSTAEPYAEAIVELNASDMSYVASWQVRGNDKADLDFGSTPTLFTATIGGATHAMLGVPNKDGRYYALDRNAISHGPVWTAILGRTGSCPTCGNGSIAPSA